MTNFEKIKTMSVKEMAYYFCNDLPICPLKAPHCKDNNCPVCFERWLESKVNDEDCINLIATPQAEIKGLKSIEPTEEVRVKFEEVVNKIRAETIKEFADRLKSKCRDSVELDNYRMTVVTKSDIDDIVEEMVK